MKDVLTRFKRLLAPAKIEQSMSVRQCKIVYSMSGLQYHSTGFKIEIWYGLNRQAFAECPCTRSLKTSYIYPTLVYTVCK